MLTTRQVVSTAPTDVDVLGIGFGPANIALAIALEDLGCSLDVRFLERRPRTRWQEGMLLEDSDIQNHPLRDLVTPRNPRSRYSFTNFLFENGRLFEHLNLGLMFPLRVEYDQYIQWAAGFFSGQVEYGVEVASIEPLEHAGAGGVLQGYLVRDTTGRQWRARALVVAPGRTPNIPELFRTGQGDSVVHLSGYLPALTRLQGRVSQPRIAVVGGSQSAVEILLHAHETLADAVVVGITRNFGFRQKDTSPFSEEVYFPQFVQTFFHASPQNRQRLRRQLESTNYSAADKDVIERLYTRLYLERVQHRQRLQVLTNTQVDAVRTDDCGVELSFQHVLDGRPSTACFDLVVLATGFLDIGTGPKREPYPALLAGLAPILDMSGGHLDVAIDYRVKFAGAWDRANPLYLNGLCESTHGMGDSGSFSLLALRSGVIAESLVAALCPRQPVHTDNAHAGR